MVEAIGISGVVVKCVDIWKNVKGEGRFLGRYWCWDVKVRGVNRIRYFGSFSCKWCRLGVGGIDFFCVDVNVLSLLLGEYGCKVKI